MRINAKISDMLIAIGTNVKRIRIEKNLTQQGLAYMCGDMDKATISNIERFACDGLRLATIIKIANVLDVYICDLLKEEVK